MELTRRLVFAADLWHSKALHVTIAALHQLLVFGAVTNVYGLGLLIAGSLIDKREIFDTPFTLRKFYTLMGWVPLAFVALGLIIDRRYFAFFLVMGAAGIVGELLVSLLWRRFFEQPIWTYSYRAVLSGYTSTINFLPWAVGALLFHFSARALGASPASAGDVLRPMLVASAALAVGLLLSMLLRGRTSARRGVFTRGAFAVFCLPIAVTLVALGVLCSPLYALMMAVFAVVGSTTEYAYGRGMSLFFQQGLWTYNHWKVDGGHSSVVTLPLWSLGGVYFYFISSCLGL